MAYEKRLKEPVGAVYVDMKSMKVSWLRKAILPAAIDRELGARLFLVTSPAGQGKTQRGMWQHNPDATPVIIQTSPTPHSDGDREESSSSE